MMRRFAGLLVRMAAMLLLLWLLGFALFTATIPQSAPVSVATDAVVVLTGGPGRLARGVAVMEAGAGKRLLISGVDTPVTRDELAAILDPASDNATRRRHRALFGSVVDLGYFAVDTRSNAEETSAWMARHHYRSLRLVTSAWHMRRAAMELRAQLPPDIRLVTDAVPIEPAAASVAREYNKFVLRWAALKLGVE